MRAALLALILGVGCGSATPQRTTADVPRPADGVALYEQKRFAEAEAALESATSGNSSDARAWAYLGLTRVELGKLEEAVAALQRALELDPEHAEAHFGMGLAQARLGRVDEAIGELERAVRANARHAYAHYHLGLAYNERGRKDRALIHLTRFLELAPDAPEAPQVRALVSRLS